MRAAVTLNNLAYAQALVGRPKEGAEVCQEIQRRVNEAEALFKGRQTNLAS